MRLLLGVLTAWGLCKEASPTVCACKDTKGEEYVGLQNYTRQGYTCAAWNSINDPMNMSQPGNYCRNHIGLKEAPWCYLSDGSWDYCGVPECGCDGYNPVECGCPALRKSDYRGKIHTTVNGKLCQNWSAQYPTEHKWYTPTNVLYEFEGLYNNYCRNPLNESKRPWCYLAEEPFSWDYCDVPKCGSYKPTTAPSTTYITDKEGGEDCGLEVMVQTFETRVSLKIIATKGNLRNGNEVLVRKADSEWETLIKDGEYMSYVDKENYSLGVKEQYEFTVGDNDHNPICSIMTVHVMRSDPVCTGISISHLLADGVVLDGFKTSFSYVDAMITVDGWIPDGQVLETSTDGIVWNTVEEVGGEYSYKISTEDDKAVEIELKVRFRFQEETCTAVTQKILLDPYKPKFDMDVNIEIPHYQRLIGDLDTTRGDDNVVYEVISASDGCEDNHFSKHGDWYAWTWHVLEGYSGYIHLGWDDTSKFSTPYLVRGFSGFEGLDELELDIDIRGTVTDDKDPKNKWGKCTYLVNNTEYIIWQNPREDKNISATGYNNATVCPTELIPTTYKVIKGDFTTSRVVIPWNRADDRASFRFEIESGGDDFWLGKIIPVGEIATVPCVWNVDYGYQFYVEADTGKLYFNKAPDVGKYRVRVKASTGAGEAGYLTLNVEVK